MQLTSFCASIADSKNVSTPDLKSSTFSRSNLSSSALINRPMSSNSSREECTRLSASDTSACIWPMRSCWLRPALKSFSCCFLTSCSLLSAACHEWYAFCRCSKAFLMLPISRMYSSMTIPSVRTSCIAWRS